MKRFRLLLFSCLSLILAACWDVSQSPATGSSLPHFQIDYSDPGKSLVEATSAAQSGQPFTATLRLVHPNAPLGKSASVLEDGEVVNVNVQFTGSEYLVQNPDSGNWVTLTEILAEEAEDDRDVLAKIAYIDNGLGEPVELPDKTVEAEPEGDIIILAATLTAGAGIVLWKAAKWGWKKLFGKKRPRIKDPGIKIDEKITKQMQKRGWDQKSIEETIKNPDKTAKAIDRTANNEPATAFFDKSGNYVVRNDKTGNIVQVSDKNKPGWVPDPSFQ